MVIGNLKKLAVILYKEKKLNIYDKIIQNTYLNYIAYESNNGA